MEKTKKRRRAKYRIRREFQHKISVIGITGVIVLLAVILSVGSISLHEKNEEFKAQESALAKQLEAEKSRSEEIDELEEYVGTDEYVQDVAKEKLGLVNPNEILFKAEP